MGDRSISRREFLKSGVKVTAAGLVGGMLLGSRPAFAAPPDPSRVVVVSDPAVWLGSGTTNDEIDALRAADMMAEGLTQLTGQSTIEAALQALIPSTPPYSTAKVALKINNISQYLPAHYAVVRPVYDALIAIGFQASNITAYDTRGLKAAGGPFSGNINFVYYDQNTSDDGSWGGSANIAGHTVRWPLTLYNADWQINFTQYKDHTAGSPAITAACKNNLGSINKGAAGFPCAGSELADLNAHPQISPYWTPGMGGKCVLYVDDAIFGSIASNSPTEPVDCAPQRIYLSCDPVNMDHVVWTDMNNIEGVSQAEPPHLAPAVSLGVGVRDLSRVLRVDIPTDSEPPQVQTATAELKGTVDDASGTPPTVNVNGIDRNVDGLGNWTSQEVDISTPSTHIPVSAEDVNSNAANVDVDIVR